MCSSLRRGCSFKKYGRRIKHSNYSHSQNIPTIKWSSSKEFSNTFTSESIKFITNNLRQIKYNSTNPLSNLSINKFQYWGIIIYTPFSLHPSFTSMENQSLLIELWNTSEKIRNMLVSIYNSKMALEIRFLLKIITKDTIRDKSTTCRESITLLL